MRPSLPNTLLAVIATFAVGSIATQIGAGAQTLTGRVLEDRREIPIAGATVALVDRDGDRRAVVISDSLGRFTLSPPAEGQYSVVATRVGYRTTRSPLFALGTSGSSTFDILMTAEPVGLAGFEVSVEREADVLLRSYGVTREILGQRWIGRRELDEMPLPRGAREAIRWRAIPGVWVDEHATELESELCVTFRRGRSWRGSEVCAVILLNGVEISTAEAQQIDPGHLEAIAVLTPLEATAFYGTGAGGGMVLMFTRRGGR